MNKSTVILLSIFGVIFIFEAGGVNALFSSQSSPFDIFLRKKCPLCDSSVYSYCSDKLFHDSCCCRNTNNPYDKYPYECQYADCRFLHANSCYEHKLISGCCCTNYL